MFIYYGELHTYYIIMVFMNEITSKLMLTNHL